MCPTAGSYRRLRWLWRCSVNRSLLFLVSFLVILVRAGQHVLGLCADSMCCVCVCGRACLVRVSRMVAQARNLPTIESVNQPTTPWLRFQNPIQILLVPPILASSVLAGLSRRSL